MVHQNTYKTYLSLLNYSKNYETQILKDRIESLNNEIIEYEKKINMLTPQTNSQEKETKDWFVFLEKIKKSANPLLDFARGMISNTNTIRHFREIENKYLELDAPNFHKT